MKALLIVFCRDFWYSVCMSDQFFQGQSVEVTHLDGTTERGYVSNLGQTYFTFHSVSARARVLHAHQIKKVRSV